MKILPNGNIVIPVQLLPDAYAALMATVERDNLSKTDAINAAIIGWNALSAAADKAGHSLGAEPPADEQPGGQP